MTEPQSAGHRKLLAIARALTEPRTLKSMAQEAGVDGCNAIRTMQRFYPAFFDLYPEAMRRKLQRGRPSSQKGKPKKPLVLAHIRLLRKRGMTFEEIGGKLGMNPVSTRDMFMRWQHWSLNASSTPSSSTAPTRSRKRA